MPLILTKADQDAIQGTLKEALQKSKARCIALVDQGGRCLAHVAPAKEFDVDALAALTAASFASTRALAVLVGETEFFSLLHQGETKRIHNIVVDNERLLSVVFDQRATAGKVRLAVETAAERLAARFREIARRGASEVSPLQSSLAEDTGKRLDQLFDS